MMNLQYRLPSKCFLRKNYEVLLADTEAKGLDIALKNLPDVILLDLRLPDIYGIIILFCFEKIQQRFAIIIL